MRILRDLPDERTAHMLIDALNDNGIETDLKETQANTFSVWVLDETQLDTARELSQSWLDAPSSSEAFALAAARGRSARELQERSDLRKRQQMEAVAKRFEAHARPRPTPLTWGLIGLCIALAILTKNGDDKQMVTLLTIANPMEPVQVTMFSLFGKQVEWLALPWSEPWRLFTPMLVHFGLLHILFNMLWLRDLGRMVEARHGTGYLLVFILLSGLISNVAQFQIGQNALFAGMSGVVYGLLGLVWIRGKLDPSVGYGITQFTVQFMLIWLVLGFLRPDFSVANWCHLFGLLVGLVWGFISAKRAVRRRS